ncbi:hypothetical protein AUP42_02485 [Thalassospira lucentensis]|uniref:Uncharacterized protein n=1 Tax=Thalassospira lucentensis TaxID=168935 RepID=A0A154L540_9PROT|nr:hypothetical protein AUP42_02485 [Thalassospira lucentensis]
MGPLAIGQDGRGPPWRRGSQRDFNRQRLAELGSRWQTAPGDGLLEGAVQGDWCDRLGSVDCLDFVFAKRGISDKGASAAKVGGTTCRRQHGRIAAGCLSSGSEDQGDSLRRLDGSSVPVWISAFSERGISAEGAARQGFAGPRVGGSMGGSRQVPVIGRGGGIGVIAWRCVVGIGRAWRGLGWPGWIWLGRAVWQIRHWTKPPTVRNSGGRFVLNIGSKDALGKACQNQHDGMKVPTLCHISLPVLRTGSG